MALGAQVSLLWQTTLSRVVQAALDHVDSVLATINAVQSIAELQKVVHASTENSWQLTVVVYDQQHAHVWDAAETQISATLSILKKATPTPTFLPKRRPAWVPKQPGVIMQMGPEQQPLGVVVVTSEYADLPALRTSCVLLARTVAATFERLYVATAIVRREKALDAFTHSLQGLAQQLDVDAFLQMVLVKATELLEAAGGGIYTFGTNPNILEVKYIHQFPAKYLGARLKVGLGVVGKVAKTATSSLVNHYAESQEHIALPKDVPVTALAAVPLRDGDALSGVLAVAHVDATKAFTTADLELLESFAAQASLALRTANLFAAQRRQSRELFVLYENSRSVGSSLDQHHILDRLTENVLLALNVEKVTAWLYNEAGRSFELAALAIDDDFNAELADEEIGSQRSSAAQTLLAHVAETQQPLAIANVATDKRVAADQAWFEQHGLRSALGVPLIVHDTLVGVLVCAVYTHAQSWSPSDITLSQTLAGQAAIAIGNARLLNDERRRGVELSLLQELSSRLNAGLNLSAVLEAVGEGVQKLLTDIQLEICLYDPETETLRSGYASAVVRDNFASESGIYRLDEGFSGWLARHRTPLRIGNTVEQRTVRPMREPDDSQVYSYLGVPMLVGDELIGTLELGSPQLHHFDEEDERLVTIIASQAAQAIRNVRRYEATDEVLRERVRELTALQRISRELTSTLRLEQLLPAMLTEIVQATNCDQGLVALATDDTSNTFEVVSALGFSADFDIDHKVAQVLQHGVLADHLQRADAIIIDDSTTLDPPLVWPNVRSLLMAPILYENRVAGAIIATDSVERTFNHTALDFVRSVSDQAALAIGNSQHFAEQVRQRELLQQRASLLNEVLEIGNALRADMELSVLLEQIAFSVSEAAGYRIVLFHLLDPEHPKQLKLVTGAGLALTELDARREAEIQLDRYDPYFDPQYRIGRVYFVPAPNSNPDATAWETTDQLLVPLYNTSRELIGIMTVDDPFNHERPNRRIVETLEIFANQAAIAVENASLFEVRTRQIAELAAINRISRAATSSLDFNALAHEVYEVLRETLPLEAYYLGVFNDNVDEVLSSYGVEHEHITVNVNKGPLNPASLTGWMAAHREPLLFSDLPKEVQLYTGMQWQQMGELISRSWIGMPLITGEGVIQGVLSIQHSDVNRYSARDVDLLQTVANQLAVAIENSRLFGNAQRRLQELALVNRIGSVTSSTLDFEEILREVYRALCDILPIDVFYSFIYDPQREEIDLRVNVDEGRFFIEHQREKLLSRSPSEWIINHKEPLLFTDMPVQMKGRFKVKRFGNLARRVRSWVGVPLRINAEESVGLLSIQHYQPNMYSEREQALLQTIANQVSLAVQNARLFAERERQIRELDAIGKIGQLMSASFVLDDMLLQTAKYLQEVTSAPIFFTLVYDPEHNMITRSFAIQEGVLASAASQGGPPRPGSLSEWVLKHREPLILVDINDAESMTQLNLVPVSNPVEGKIRGPRSWIGVPIFARDGAPIGLLSLQDYNVGTFDERTVSFLTNVSSHVSLGLQKVELFQQRDRQIRELETMRRIGQVTSSTLDMDEMMHNVYHVLTESLPVESFVINIYDSQIDMLVYSLLIDRDQQIQVPPVRAVRPRSLTDWILRHRQPLLFRNLAEELSTYPDIEPLQHGQGPTALSWMGVPLMAKSEHPIGVLALQHYDAERFSVQDLDFLSNIAYQVTLGVQNVRLYEQTEQSLQQLGAEAERLALINHVSNLTASTLDPQVLYSLAVEEMAHVSGADQARLVIFDYEQNLGIARAEYPPSDVEITVPVEGNATLPWMQQHRRPLIINDVETNPLAEGFREILGAMGIHRLMLVPLIVKGELIGSVGLDSHNESKMFTPRDAETCQTIANQVSQALENARLFAETERQASVLSRKVGELSVLLEAGQALSSIREPDQVLHALVRLVARQLQADTVVLSTFNSEQILVPAASLGLPNEFVKSMRVAAGQGLIGSVAQTVAPLTVADVQNMPPNSQYPDFNRDHHLVSFLGVPVLYREEVMGVLSVMTNSLREFSDDDIALLSALADQAAIALENARLFTERERQITMLQALNDVTQSITSTLNTDQLLRELHAQLGKVVDNRYSFIALYDDTTNMLTFPVLIDNSQPREQAELPLSSGVLSQVVLERRTIVLNTAEETAESSRLVLGSDVQMASWIGVPIISGDHVLGVINIQNERPRSFTPEIVQFLQSVGSQAAIALENARLFAERERQIAEAEILAAIGQSITSTLSPEALTNSVLEGIRPVLDVQNAYIVLYDAPSGMVTTTFGYSGGKPFHVPPHLLNNDFLKTLMFEQQPVILNTSAAIDEFNISPRLTNVPTELAFIEPHSVLAVPITMGSQTTGMHLNQPLGVLTILSEQPYAYTDAHLRFLNAVANQSSNAVQKAILFSERERRIRELDTLNRISQSITSTINLDEILARLHDGLSEIVDTSTSFIGLYDDRTNVMHYEQAYDQGVQIHFPSAPLGVNVNSWVIQNRQPLLLNTFDEANEYRDEVARARVIQARIGAEGVEQSYLVVPIIVGNTVLGVINLQSYEQYAFSEYDMGFVSTMAAQAAASIANARLFEARERSIQQLRTLSTIGQAMGSTVRFEDLLQVIYEQTSLLVDTRNFYLAMYDERRDEVTFPLFFEHGEPLEIEPQRGLNGLTEYVIKARQPLVLQGDIKRQLESLNVQIIGEMSRSWVGIPLIAADKVIGVMSIQDYEHDAAYNDDDIQLLSTVANQAAQALENARLFSESRESVRELSTLSDTSVSLASTLDVDELLAISASSAIEMARADFGGVIVIDVDTDMVTHSLILDNSWNELPMTLSATSITSFKMLRPLREGQVVTLYDAAVDEKLAPLIQPLGIRGVVFLPMMREGLRGVVFVAMRSPYTFEDRSIASLLILTTQIGQALNNAQLFDQIRRFNLELEEIVAQRTQALADANAQLTGEKERVEALYNIATELGTTLDRSELLVRTLDLSAKALNVDRGTVLMLDRETRKLTCQAVLNEELGLRSLDTPVEFEENGGLAYWVLNNSEGVVIEDVTNDSRWMDFNDGRNNAVRSVIAVPLFSSDQPQGVLMLYNANPSFFSIDHLRFLSTIAGEVSSALHNADLYNLVYDSADRLSDAMWQQREEASKTTAILQSISEGVIVLDHDTERIILYNPAAEEVLRIPRPAVIDQNLQAFAQPRDEEELHEEGRALLLYTGLHEGIQYVQQNDAVQSSLIELPGQIIAANFAPVTGEGGLRFGVVVVLRDITREVEADRAKRDFIATVSHELRTPLTPIRGFVDLMLLGAVGDLSDPQRETLNTIKSNTLRMVSLVEDLLEIGRLEAGKIKLNTSAANVNQMVRDVVGMWTNELNTKNMTLTLELDDTLPLIEYDSKRIGQVMTNLVSNAIKYTYAGGVVRIRTFRNEDNLIQVDVQDTGVGLTPDQQKNLFKRFYRADSPLRDEVGGTGLGLSIAKSFVELHHGDMWVQSVYGEGSTFSFSLPEKQPLPDLGPEDDGQELASVQTFEETAS